MSAVILIIIAGLILSLKQLGIIKRPLVVFLIAAAVILSYAYILKDAKVGCPFFKIPFCLDKEK
ncbi:MAG: hypothetical protein HQ547_00860 [Candidatus Omnitrophica bacterium]|nr:hypothetical protein [Candidatus Omnitrophota bacterium]